MLGNDVVDLALAKAESNWRRQNYLSKIFSPTEQQIIRSAVQPDILVWLMWSMKESTYKIINRDSGLRLFNPTAFCCSFKMNGLRATGFVNFREQMFLTHSDIDTNCIHTLSLKASVSKDRCHVLSIENSADYRAEFNRQSSGLILEKDHSGLPQIVDSIKNTVHMASISHHGKFVKVAYMKQ